MAIQCIEYNASNAAFAMVLNCGVDLLENSLLLKAVKASDVRFLTCILHAGTSANTRLLCGNCLLHLACSAAMVQLLVKWGAGLNAVNAKGETPLHYMCLREHVKEDVLSALLAAGANINAKSHSGQTALHCVLKGELRSLDLVEQLVRAGADVNALDVDGVSPLELAMTLPHFHSLVGSLLLKAGASAKRPMVRCATPFNCGVWYRFDAGFVRELIRAGADVNTVDKNGNTLMHIAIVKNQGERVVFELLQAGANINAANNAGQTPLSLAVSAKKPSQEIIMMLLNSGSTALDHHRGTMVLKVAEWSDEQILVAMIDHCGSNVNIVDENGESALIAAVRMRSAGIVSRLIALGANVNFARTSDGATALHVAINNGHYAMTNMLLRAGADVKAADSSGFTAAHFAVALGDNQLVRHLIKAGANVNSVTSSGDSLLHFAAAATKIKSIVCRLVRAGSNIDSVNSRQQTPCHIAVRNVGALCALIDAGAAVDCEDHDGNTPLCNALVAGVRSSVDALVAAGANVRFLHRTGATLLHIFLSNAQVPRPDLVRWLVSLGCDVNAVDGNGQTASQVAVNKANRACLRTLFGCGADLTTLVLNESCVETGQLMVAAGWKTTRPLREPFHSLLIAAESDDARAHVQLAVTRLELVRARGFEVCVGLQSMQLDALQLSEIIRYTSAPAGDHMPFHVLWNIAVKVKHFKSPS